ncbi:MAG: NTPase [bacterium]
MPANILITGRPGVGKTTIIKKVAAHFGNRARGFYTEEIRKQGKRQGFSVTTLSGESGLLAHVDVQSPYRVGKYGVLVADFEQIAVIPLFQNLRDIDLIILDEIGKMELFSSRFVELVLTLIDFPILLFASLMSGSHPTLSRIMLRKDVTLFTVDEENRDSLPEKLIAKIESHLSR